MPISFARYFARHKKIILAWFLRSLCLGVAIAGWTYVFIVWRNQPAITLVPVLENNKFLNPTMLRELPNLSGFVVAEKAGLIKWFPHNSSSNENIILDIRAKVYSLGYEEGLLSFVFDPKFSKNRFMYVFYSMENPKRSRVSRFVIGNNWTVNANSELPLLEIPKARDEHNGGMLEFGKDGYLYISVGEGRIPERKDADRILPSKTTLLGTILRIDVANAQPSELYRIPSDNPFSGAGGNVRKEIWANGFRNPWRFSFDDDSQSLFVNDVGGIKFEEINRVAAGNNYGWPFMEGEECHYSSDHDRCDKQNKELPLAAFAHASGILCITGGYVYRGKDLTNLRGSYIFTDLYGGIFAINFTADKKLSGGLRRLHPGRYAEDEKGESKPLHLVSLYADHVGELYVINFLGKVFKLQPLKAKPTFKTLLKNIFGN